MTNEDIATNEETAREFLRRFGEGNYDAIYELQAVVDWKIFPGPAEAAVPWFGWFRGREAAESCMAEFERTVEVRQFVVRDFLFNRDHVAAVIEARYRVRETGQEFALDFVNVMEFQNGKIVSVREYGDTAEAVRAFPPLGRTESFRDWGG
jgi:ketosteroid isomerase-like protein